MARLTLLDDGGDVSDNIGMENVFLQNVN